MSLTRLKMSEIKQFILANLEKHPQNIVTHVARQFHISRQAAYKHLKPLLQENRVIVEGKKTRPVYKIHPSKKIPRNPYEVRIEKKFLLKKGRTLKEVFLKYSDADGFSFSKTHIHVALVSLGEEFFIARSQAKRILFNLEKFSHITLDFKGISSVGQGFVDEIFRVFKKDHPSIHIDYRNANKNILFMIQRSQF